MAFEMDELNQRKQQRQQRQEARRKQEQKTRVRLLVALGILVLCGIAIAIVSLRDKPVTPPQTEPPVQTTQPSEAQQTQPSETTLSPDGFQPTTVIRFAAAGDLNITDKVVASGGSEYDYTPVFMDVLELLTEADLTAMNFEGNACGAPYGKDSAPQQLLDALRLAGVDVLQVANSKSINKGVSGLNATVRNIRAANIACVGALAEGDSGPSYVIRYVDGVKVAVVAFTKGMDGMAMPQGSEDLVNLLYTDYSSTYKKVDTKKITAVLRSVAEEKPDITIAMLHWGSEYSDMHSDTQESIRKLLIKEGVDVIIGSHPHYVQEMTFDEEAGTFVAYSLGDFLGDAARSGTAYSVVLNLEITKDNTSGITKVTGYTYTPIYTVEDANGALRVVRLREAIGAYEAARIGCVTKEVYDSMVYGLKRIESRINPEKDGDQ